MVQQKAHLASPGASDGARMQKARVGKVGPDCLEGVQRKNAQAHAERKKKRQNSDGVEISEMVRAMRRAYRQEED